MNKQDQAIKNMELVQELADFIAKHPSEAKQTSETVSYVAFSATDNELNEANEKMIASMVKEGKKIIKAIKTNDKLHPWKFLSATSV